MAKKVTMSVIVENDLLQQLRDVAEDEERSVGSVVRQLVIQGLKRARGKLGVHGPSQLSGHSPEVD